MKIVQVTESKVGKMTEYAEHLLHYGGKLMQCIEELAEGSRFSEEGYGERGYGGRSGGGYGERMGRRGGYGERMGEEEEWNEKRRFPGNDPYYRSDGNLSNRMGGRYM